MPIDDLDDIALCPSADLPVSNIGTARLLIYLLLEIVKRVLLSRRPRTVLEMRHSGGVSKVFRLEEFILKDLCK